MAWGEALATCWHIEGEVDEYTPSHVNGEGLDGWDGLGFPSPPR